MTNTQSEALADLDLQLDLCKNAANLVALYELKKSADRVRRFDPLAAEKSWLEGLGAVLEYGNDEALVAASRLFEDDIKRLLESASVVSDSPELVTTLRDVFDRKVLLDAFVEGNEARIDNHRFTSLLEIASLLGVECDGRALRHALAGQVYDARWTQDVSAVRKTFKHYLPTEVAAVWVEDGSGWLSFPSLPALTEALRIYVPEGEVESLIDQLSTTLNNSAEATVDWLPEDMPFISDEVQLMVHQSSDSQDLMFSIQGENGLADIRHFAIFHNRYEDLIYRDPPIVEFYVGPPSAMLESVQRKAAVERYVLTPTSEGVVVTWPVSFQVDLPRLVDVATELVAGDPSGATGEIVDSDSSQIIMEPVKADSLIPLTKIATWQVPLPDNVESTKTSLGLVKVRVRVPYGPNPQKTGRLATALGVATSQRFIKFDHLGVPDWKVDLRRGGTIEQVGPIDELTWSRFWPTASSSVARSSDESAISPAESNIGTRKPPELEAL